MNFIKVLGSISVILSCGICGFYFGQIYKNRTRGLLKARQILKEVLSRLEFTLDTPERIITAVSQISSLSCDYLTNSANLILNGKSFIEAFEESVSKTTIPFLHEDIILISTLTDILGKSDLETQIQAIETLIRNIEHSIEQSQSLEENGQRLSQTLGVLSGFTVVILLI